MKEKIIYLLMSIVLVIGAIGCQMPISDMPPEKSGNPAVNMEDENERLDKNQVQSSSGLAIIAIWDFKAASSRGWEVKVGPYEGSTGHFVGNNSDIYALRSDGAWISKDLSSHETAGFEKAEHMILTFGSPSSGPGSSLAALGEYAPCTVTLHYKNGTSKTIQTAVQNRDLSKISFVSSYEDSYGKTDIYDVRVDLPEQTSGIKRVSMMIDCAYGHNPRYLAIDKISINEPVPARHSRFASNKVLPAGDTYQRWLKGDDGCNIIPGDFNGDGKTDFIKQEKGAWAKDDKYTFGVYFSKGNGYFNAVFPKGTEYQKYLNYDRGCNIIPGDFNGDGKTDFIRQEKGGWDNDNKGTFQVYFSKGNGYFNIVTPAGDTYQRWLKGDDGCNIIPGDFNGDGKTDFIKQEKGGWASDDKYTFGVYFSKGNGYFDYVFPNGRDYQVNLNYDRGCTIIPGDFNGDGKTDFIRQEKGGWAADSRYSFNIYFSKGNGYFNVITPSGTEYQQFLRGDVYARLIPGDFDGDGKTDFIRHDMGTYPDDNQKTFSVYFSGGNGYFNSYAPEGKMYQYDLNMSNGANLIPGDYNGDGKTDFIRQEKNFWDHDEINTFSVYFTK